jgi:hypothetical protein
MPLADVLDLMTQIAGVEIQSPQINDYYVDVGKDLAHHAVFCLATLQTTTAGTAEYTLDPSTVEVLVVLYGTGMLVHATMVELEQASFTWRDTTGTPIVYNDEELSKHIIRLYPNPTLSSGALNFPTGTPLGTDFPARALAVICSQIRVDYPTWMDLPLALLISSLEFNRDSDHKNPTFVDACKGLGELLLTFAVGDLTSERWPPDGPPSTGGPQGLTGALAKG